MRLAQIRAVSGERAVAVTLGDGSTRRVRSVNSTYALATQAAASGTTVDSVVAALGLGEELSLTEALEERRILAPIDHPDPAHVWLTGTGLTHLGSADARERMHAKMAGEGPSDSMKMFLAGIDGGKAAGGGPGVQPEWFYKGNGRVLIGPEEPLASPSSPSMAAKSRK